MIPPFFSWFIAFLFIAGFGYTLSRWIPRPRQPLSWLFWLISLVISQHMLVSAMIISIPGYTLYGNTLLQGLIFGILAAFLMRQDKKAEAVEKPAE